MKPTVSVPQLPPDGVPCKHPGCLSHISHPCEGCGRIGGRISVPTESRPTAREVATWILSNCAARYVKPEGFSQSPQDVINFQIHMAEVKIEEFVASLPVGESTRETIEARRLGMQEAFDLCAVIADEGHEKAAEHETGTGTIGLVGLGSKILASVIRSRKESLIAARMTELGVGESREPQPQTKTEVGTQEKP